MSGMVPAAVAVLWEPSLFTTFTPSIQRALPSSLLSAKDQMPSSGMSMKPEKR